MSQRFSVTRETYNETSDSYDGRVVFRSDSAQSVYEFLARKKSHFHYQYYITEWMESEDEDSPTGWEIRDQTNGEIWMPQHIAEAA